MCLCAMLKRCEQKCGGDVWGVATLVEGPTPRSAEMLCSDKNFGGRKGDEVGSFY